MRTTSRSGRLAALGVAVAVALLGPAACGGGAERAPAPGNPADTGGEPSGDASEGSPQDGY